MGRRRQFEDPPNQDRWLVSYADFITLLFAFFVVMYSISSVNVDKYRVLSDAMVSAFKVPRESLQSTLTAPLLPEPMLLPNPFNEADPARRAFIAPLRPDYQQNGSAMPDEAVDPEPEGDSFAEKVRNAAEEQIDVVSDNVEQGMEEWIDSDIVDIKRNQFWLEIEIKSSLLFTSGSSALIPEALPLLRQLATMFVGVPNRVNVEGFTDDRPISTAAFPSNWELSSARAAAVVRLFQNNGVDPARLASIGYGENRPIASNDNDVARAKNRRVVIVVMASADGAQDERIQEFDLLRDNATAGIGG